MYDLSNSHHHRHFLVFIIFVDLLTLVVCYLWFRVDVDVHDHFDLLLHFISISATSPCDMRFFVFKQQRF